jgi:WD40 repeat protein
VPAAVAQMQRGGGHVFPAPAVLRPRVVTAKTLPSAGRDVAFSRGDGALLAVVCNDGTVQMRHSARGDEIWSVRGHQHVVWSCSFTRDDALLATVSDDETVKLWRTSDGSLAHTLTGQSLGATSVACSPAADVLLSGDNFGVVKVWDTATGAELHTLPHHPWLVTAVAFDASGALAAAGWRNGQIRLFDARAGWQLLTTLQAHTRDVWGLQFSPAGASATPYLTSGSVDGTTKLWQVHDPCQPRLARTLHDNNEWALTASFSPDGALLATGYYDRTVKLWRVADGALLHTVAAHHDSVYSVAFHPRDASALATCGQDSTLNLWQL